MSTRALIRIFDEEVEICTIYKHTDGYPDPPHGLGHKLQEFLKDFTVTCGITDYNSKTANGMDCLAAQIISYLKEGVGDVYIKTPGTKDVWEEYTYIITQKDDKVKLECKDD